MLLTRVFSRSFSNSVKSNADYSHLVIGAGVIGLGVASELSKQAGNSVLVVEKHGHIGSETSARNSEVIHAGIYHAPDTLRTQLCLRGKELLYQAKKLGVELRQCGKWIVSQNEKEDEYLHKMYKRVSSLGVPIEWVNKSESDSVEPFVKVGGRILNSSSTGIVNAHSFMLYLQSIFEANNGELVLNTEVKGISYSLEFKEYIVSTVSDNGEFMDITVENIVNSAGLYAPDVSNMLLPAERHYTAYYAKGNYFAYIGSKVKVNRLIYPCPSDHASLGTHLTIDLGGRIKFGPDIEWVDSPTDLKANGNQLDEVFDTISLYMKGIERHELVPDYAGIRPKIAGPCSTFVDFTIKEEPGFPGFINLLAMDSPGLTSSLAIGEHVAKIYHS
ncbi:putative FAD-dependent oxidoreductase [Nadsonia fulvescens var. elongata DSM 6958]|uniref:L-2-hydroxyglutarate dehydrogenase, mitochondrial n=1 Tax=Nadsonia fulvescens var. elongata DSM 6958 TaxID=857566 RepID=A0A1E3PGQ3_9ASCO|nr:putative FAD-dependent oxidoreductase [Nadsonia fulvescens var. elongata DSM 6958]